MSSNCPFGTVRPHAGGTQVDTSNAAYGLYPCSVVPICRRPACCAACSFDLSAGGATHAPRKPAHHVWPMRVRHAGQRSLRVRAGLHVRLRRQEAPVLGVHHHAALLRAGPLPGDTAGMDPPVRGPMPSSAVEHAMRDSGSCSSPQRVVWCTCRAATGATLSSRRAGKIAPASASK